MTGCKRCWDGSQGFSLIGRHPGGVCQHLFFPSQQLPARLPTDPPSRIRWNKVFGQPSAVGSWKKHWCDSTNSFGRKGSNVDNMLLFESFLGGCSIDLKTNLTPGLDTWTVYGSEGGLPPPPPSWTRRGGPNHQGSLLLFFRRFFLPNVEAY